MARYMLDTSALLAHYRQEQGWETVQALFEQSEAEILIASPTLTEFGRRLVALGAGEDDIRESLHTYSLLMTSIPAIDQKTALTAYTLGRQTPERIPLIDTLIAAAAVENSAILVHRDPHMTHIPASLLSQQSLAP
jgi:predicted nucleic acid-binding protein